MTGALDQRLTALAEAVRLADGRLAPEAVEAARDVVARAGERLGHGLDATVIALGGPTGAGKSTLFNLLVGRELSRAGVRRPTTSTTTAAVGSDVDAALLDWLDVRSRHALDEGAPPGLVLLDLPDFDSIEATHRAEVDRLVANGRPPRVGRRPSEVRRCGLARGVPSSRWPGTRRRCWRCSTRSICSAVMASAPARI